MALGFYGFRGVLPEFGITETVSDLLGKQRNTQGGSRLLPVGNQTPVGSGQVQGAIDYSSESNFTPAPQASVSTGGGFGDLIPSGGGRNISQTAGGGSGGGQTNGGQSPFEQAPEQIPGSEFDAAIQPAIDALNQFEGALQASQQQAIQEAESGAERAKGEARSEESRRLEALGLQRQEQKQQASSAIAQARRQAAELQQGIQSRYGGATGTGQFVSEILGSQATRNIAANQQALQQTISQIQQAENNVRSRTQELISEINENLQTAKDRARVELQQALADIAGRRGELQSRKAEMRLQALQNYQDLLAGIEARNAQFRQQLFGQAQRATQQLETFKNSALQQFNAQFQGFEPPTFNVGDKTVAAFPSGSNLRGVTYISGQGSEDEDQLPQVQSSAAAEALGL